MPTVTTTGEHFMKVDDTNREALAANLVTKDEQLKRTRKAEGRNRG